MKTYAKSIENRTNKTVLEAILIAALIAVTAVFGACDFFVTLTSITAEYVGGDVELNGTIDKADFVVKAKYSNGSEKTVTNFVISGFDSSTAGDKTVTVSFTDNNATKTATVTVTVADSGKPDPATLDSITAEYVGSDVDVGGTLDESQIQVTAHYSDGSDKAVTDFEISGFDSASAGTKRVNVSYTENGVTVGCELEVAVVDNGQSVVINSNLSVHFLELGNQYTGDCVYIKAGETDILIDAGSRKSSASTLINYINRHVTDNKLEYVIVTHEHQDHISGFMGVSGENGIFEQYICENIIDFPKYNGKLTTDSGNPTLLAEYFNARDAEIAAGANHYTALECVNNVNGAQKVYDLTGDGAITMEILYQKYYDTYSGDPNNYSVCIMLNQKVTENKTNHYLFTGDLEESGETSLVASNSNLPEVVLFKGGHHGSYTASNDVLLNKIKPEYVCICCCAGNVEYLTKYPQDLNHSFPAQEMIDRIAKHTDKVYVTTLGKIKANGTNSDGSTKWANDGYLSMNGNICLSCINGEIALNCSNNNLKLKDTDWFKNNRVCPEAWKKPEETSEQQSA